MAFRLRALVWVDWVGPGMGPMSGQLGPTVQNAPAGGAQTLQFDSANQNSANTYTTNTFTAADITTLTNTLASDMSTQMNAAIARVQAFSTGGG